MSTARTSRAAWRLRGPRQGCPDGDAARAADRREDRFRLSSLRPAAPSANPRVAGTPGDRCGIPSGSQARLAAPAPLSRPAAPRASSLPVLRCGRPGPALPPRRPGRSLVRYWPAARPHARQDTRRSGPERTAPASAGCALPAQVQLAHPVYPVRRADRGSAPVTRLIHLPATCRSGAGPGVPGPLHHSGCSSRQISFRLGATAAVGHHRGPEMPVRLICAITEHCPVPARGPSCAAGACPASPAPGR